MPTEVGANETFEAARRRLAAQADRLRHPADPCTRCRGRADRVVTVADLEGYVLSIEVLCQVCLGR